VKAGADTKTEPDPRGEIHPDLDSKEFRNPQHNICRRDLLFFGGSRPWRSTPADCTRTRLKRLKKKNKILTIHSLVTPRQDKLREIMVKKGRRVVGERGG
jgi:hypothetical protein